MGPLTNFAVACHLGTFRKLTFAVMFGVRPIVGQKVPGQKELDTGKSYLDKKYQAQEKKYLIL